MGVAMMGFMHFYMGYTQPLFVQSLMGVKNLFDSKEIKLHILGKPAVDDLKRPFAGAPNMFGGAGGAGPATDAASIAEAGKRIGAGVAKEE
jgi:hypothetical protein